MDLEVKSAKLTRGYGGGVVGNPEWRLSLEVEPVGMHAIELETGERLARCEMWVNFRRETPGLREWLDKHAPEGVTAHGMMHYFPAREAKYPDDIDLETSLLTDIMVTEDEMVGLVDMARAGRYPRSVRLDFPMDALDYGRGGRRWDNTKSRLLAVEGVDIDIPISEPPTPDADDIELDRAVGAAPRTPVGADLRPVLERLLKWQQATLVVVVIAVLAVLAR